jgi:hypothetical protein
MNVLQLAWIKWLVAWGVGIALAAFAYRLVTDPQPARQRAAEIGIVLDAREILSSYVLPGGELQLVDPIAPDRKVGKVYIMPDGGNWEVSGFYRRNESDRWHPYLMRLEGDSELLSLAVRDSNERLIGMSAQDERFSAVP